MFVVLTNHVYSGPGAAHMDPFKGTLMDPFKGRKMPQKHCGVKTLRTIALNPRARGPEQPLNPKP